MLKNLCHQTVRYLFSSEKLGFITKRNKTNNDYTVDNKNAKFYSF